MVHSVNPVWAVVFVIKNKLAKKGEPATHMFAQAIECMQRGLRGARRRLPPLGKRKAGMGWMWCMNVAQRIVVLAWCLFLRCTCTGLHTQNGLKIAILGHF